MVTPPGYRQTHQVSGYTTRLQTDVPTDRRTYRQMYLHTDVPTHRRTYRQTYLVFAGDVPCRQATAVEGVDAEHHVDQATDRRTYRQTYLQTDVPTDRRTYRQTHLQTDVPCIHWWRALPIGRCGRVCWCRTPRRPPSRSAAAAGPSGCCSRGSCTRWNPPTPTQPCPARSASCLEIVKKMS